MGCLVKFFMPDTEDLLESMPGGVKSLGPPEGNTGLAQELTNNAIEPKMLQNKKMLLLNLNSIIIGIEI